MRSDFKLDYPSVVWLFEKKKDWPDIIHYKTTETFIQKYQKDIRFTLRIEEGLCRITTIDALSEREEKLVHTSLKEEEVRGKV